MIEMNATIDGELATCQKDRDEGRVELREVLLDLGATQEQIDAKFAAVDAKDAERLELQRTHGSLPTEETKRLLCMASTNPGGRHTYAALGDQKPRCTHCGYEPDVASYSELLGSNSPKVRRPQ